VLKVKIINYLTNNATLHCESAQPWQLGFQDPATPIMEGIVNLHHDIMFIIVVIGVFVGYLMVRAVQLFRKEVHPEADRVIHGTSLEIFWTVTPAFILLVLAVPSFALLYSVDEIIEPAITLKAVGHQWYWSYEYSDYATEEGETINFDSYMIGTDDIAQGALRLLEVDNRVVLPIRTHIRVILTAADVLHCWGVPSLALKLDACPGRLNQTSMFIKREGVFYGQCSEICGVNHGFMPICVEAVTEDKYVQWVTNQLELLGDE
jgi:cytochrome c oxidase subunit 2|tara:strand:- start:2701 stop:3489 length:789 start_codon:yes stop_codon:yes gene_type:complete